MRFLRTRSAAVALASAAAILTGCHGQAPTSRDRSHGPADAATRRPNIILITCDTLRADRIGAYGSASARTPNLDALAARSIRFERAYATYPKTNPALASLLTGRYPSAHGVRRNGAHLPESELTLAEILQAAGYDTAAFVSNHVMISRHGLAQGFHVYDDRLPDLIPTRQAQERNARSLVDAVLAWAPRPDEGPTFLWVHFIDPHGPYTPPGWKEKAARDDGTPPLPVSTTDTGAGSIPAYQALPGLTHAGEYVALYDAEVEFMDSEVGRLLEGLERNRLLEGAIVLFAADHGESLGDHGFYFQHGSSLYDSQIRVPLLISGPGIAPGVEENPVSGVDVLPTILEMLELPQPRGIQGTSLSPRSSGQESGGEDQETDRRVLFAELGSKYAAIRGSRKLIWDASAKKIELLDFEADPEESLDLSQSEPERGRRLFESVARFAKENRRDVKALDDEETKRVLKSLGYVE